MPDGGAFVQYSAVGGFQLFDDRTGGIAGCFDNCDAFVDDDLGVAVVVRRHEGRKESQVYPERVTGHASAFADFFAEIIGGGLGESREL